jgi:excisionase family DNA binding protein
MDAAASKTCTTRAAAERPADLAAFVGVSAAAQLLQVSEATIRRFLTQRKLRRYKCGARTLVKREDLLGLVKEA